MANEFLDLLTCYDLPEQGLDKLILNNFFNSQVEPFEEEVISRLANMCLNISNLQLSYMYQLTEAGRLSMVSLFRQIIQSNPTIQVFDMNTFSGNSDRDQNMGELVLDTLLNSNIKSITDLDLSSN